MTAITTRACKLGPSINCRTEKHGEDDNPACDIPLVGILLQEPEANAIVGALFWESLFDNRSQGKAPAVLHPHLAPRKVTEKYKGNVTLVMGPNQNDIELEAITLTGLKFEPLEGGLVSMCVTVQAHTDIHKYVHKLVARQNTEVEVLIAFGDKVDRAKSKQAELPMEGGGPKSDADPEAEHRAANDAQSKALGNSTPATH